jgi:hypothetical protein
MPGRRQRGIPLNEFLCREEEAKLEAIESEAKKKKALKEAIEPEPEVSPEKLAEIFALEKIRQEEYQFKITGIYRCVPLSGETVVLPKGISVMTMNFALLFVVNCTDILKKADFQNDFEAFYVQYVKKKYLKLELQIENTLASLYQWKNEYQKMHEGLSWRHMGYRFIDVVTFTKCLRALDYIGFFRNRKWLINLEKLDLFQAPEFVKFGAEKREMDWDDF